MQFKRCRRAFLLSTKSIKGSSLSLQCIHNIKRSNCLSFCVFRISHCVSDNVLKERLQNGSGFFVNESWYSLHSSSSGQSSDCGLCDTLSVVSQNFAMSLCTSFAEAFSAFSSSSHHKNLLNQENNATTEKVVSNAQSDFQLLLEQNGLLMQRLVSAGDTTLRSC